MENEPKKNLFEILEPKSAMILGIVGGLMIVCTIGFIVLAVMAATKGLNCSAGSAVKNTAVVKSDTADQIETAAVAPKSDKPVVELFVMAYCPYGLQMEKAYLPAMDLLGKKADMSVKFVSYAMHGKKELDENTRQYCIEKEQPTKFVAYLKCFTGKDDYAGCLKTTGVSESKLNACVAKTDKTFKITEMYNDKTTWLSNTYPVYTVHQAENDKYGVQGSPTLVINGVQIDAGRNPEAVKQAICAAFNKVPSECNTTLSTQSLTSGFGDATGAATDASCS
jgi:hypothetical protein